MSTYSVNEIKKNSKQKNRRNLIIVSLVLLVAVGICSNPDSKKIKQEDSISSVDIPDYTVLDATQLIDGSGVYADILIPSMSDNTANEEKEEVFEAIRKKEDFVSASFYCTQEAYKANYSESYLKDHPNALNSGLLGTLSNSGRYTFKSTD